MKDTNIFTFGITDAAKWKRRCKEDRMEETRLVRRVFKVYR